MDKFSFYNNGKEIDFSLFKNRLSLSDISIDSKFKQIFKLFDSDGNGILETSNSKGVNEMQTLLNGMLKHASANGNSIFEFDEVQQYLENTVDSEGNNLASKNISVNDVFNFLKVLRVQNNVAYGTAESYDSAVLTQSELQEMSIRTLFDDLNKARGIFNKQNREQGKVSDAVNWVKEVFQTENASSNVDRTLLMEDFSTCLIQRASSGELTYREYYEAKIEFIIQLIAKFDKSADKAKLEASRNMLKTLEPERIDCIMQGIGTITDSCPESKIPDVVKDIVNIQFEAQSPERSNALVSSREIPLSNIPKPKLKTIKNLEATGEFDKKIDFEKAFELERGVKYNSEAIDDCVVKNTQLEILAGMNNSIATVDTLLELLDKDSGDVNCSSQLVEKINSFLQRFGMSVTSQKAEIKSTLLEFKQKAELNYKNALGGKTLEEHSAISAEAYKKAYGKSNIINVVNKYVQSQKDGVQTVKTGVQLVGMAAMVVGQCIPVEGIVIMVAGRCISVGWEIASVLGYGGMITATFGGTAVSATENISKEGEMTEQDKKEIIQELSMAVVSTATGLGIGKASSTAYKMLIMQKCPKLLASATELGIDATMGLVSDAALTGEVNLTGEGISQITNILVGIIRSKGPLNKHFSTHSENAGTSKFGKTTAGIDEAVNSRLLGKSNTEANVVDAQQKAASVTGNTPSDAKSALVFGLQNKNISAPSSDSKFVELIKKADLSKEDVQLQVLKELETQFPSTRRVPGRIKTLKDFQKLVNSPEYANFDDSQKLIAQLIFLKSNPRIDSRALYDDVNLTASEKNRIKNIESCLSESSDPTMAGGLYKESDFETMLAIAKCKEGFDEQKISAMKQSYEKSQANGCLLVNKTQILTENIPLTELNKEGKSYNIRVLDCADQNIFKHPEQYGLEAGTTAENMRLTVHMNDAINDNPGMTLGQMRARDNLNLSATVTNGKNSLYGDQQVGIVLDYDMGSVGYAANYAAGTGFGKDLGDFANAKLNFDKSSSATFVRERFIDNMKNEGFEITKEDYALFSNQFQGKTLSRKELYACAENGIVNINGKQVPVETVENVLTKSTDDMMNISYELRGKNVTNGFNEIDVYQPEIKAIYIRRHSPDETVESMLSSKLLDFIQKRNIPVVIQ